MSNTLYQIINRIINTTEATGFYTDNSKDIMDELGVPLDNWNGFYDTSQSYKDEIIILMVDDLEYENRIDNSCLRSNTIVLLSQIHIDSFVKIEDCGLYIKIKGRLFESPNNINVPSDFSVLAIIHFYNEVDVLEMTISYLLNQGIDIYLIDNWSNDGSYEIAKKMQDENLERIFLERFPVEGKNDYYDWYHQLERTEIISKTYNYNWYIHYDADEMRVGPWEGLSLRETIYVIDRHGYNLIDNTVIDFKVTDERVDSNFMTDCWFDFGRRQAHFKQIKTWKKSKYIDLKSSGGHVAIVDNPRIFPLKILNRHYPMRSVGQGKKKILCDRKPRFGIEKKERGWHGHYDHIDANTNLVVNTNNLILWKENTFNEYYLQLFMGCGIDVELDCNNIYIEPYMEIPAGARIILYGAGRIGQFIADNLIWEFKLVIWVDRNFSRIPKMRCMNITDPDSIDSNCFDYMIIAIEDESIAKELIRKYENQGLKGERIIWHKVQHIK